MPGYHVSNNSDSLIVPDGPIIAPKTNGVALKENGGSINTPISQQEIKALAEQGDAQAQFNLGVAYATGKGLTQNYHEALKWYRLSAAQGNPWAQSNLGGMYRTGIGVPQDYMQAMMWYLIAKASGETNADQDLHQLASVSSPAEIAEAQRMAQEWWAAHHPVN
jgi:TPR repeat protein